MQNLDIDRWMAHTESTRGDLDAIAKLMGGFSLPWFFCGGWAIDLFLGKPMRVHKDVDIGIFRTDQAAAQAYLLGRGWELAVAENGALTPWRRGKWLDLPTHTIWCRHLEHQPGFLEVLFNEGSATQFRFRRNPTLILPGTRAILQSVDGLPYLAPEIALLYKSAHVELDGNRRDFGHVLPRMSAEQRAWLQHGLSTQYGRHPWLDVLSN
jgi:hypothetical protein